MKLIYLFYNITDTNVLNDIIDEKECKFKENTVGLDDSNKDIKIYPIYDESGNGIIGFTTDAPEMCIFNKLCVNVAKQKKISFSEFISDRVVVRYHGK